MGDGRKPFNFVPREGTARPAGKKRKQSKFKEYDPKTGKYVINKKKLSFETYDRPWQRNMAHLSSRLSRELLYELGDLTLYPATKGDILGKLRQNEKDVTINAKSLADAWGYEKKDGGKYEDETHKLSDPTFYQAYTDPLFRNLRRIANGSDEVQITDGLALFERTVDAENGLSNKYNGANWRTMLDLWREFFLEDKDRLTQIQKIATFTTTTGELSRSCFVLVYAARIFLLAASANFALSDKHRDYAIRLLTEYFDDAKIPRPPMKDRMEE